MRWGLARPYTPSGRTITSCPPSSSRIVRGMVWPPPLANVWGTADAAPKGGAPAGRGGRARGRGREGRGAGRAGARVRGAAVVVRQRARRRPVPEVPLEREVVRAHVGRPRGRGGLVAHEQRPGAAP